MLVNVFVDVFLHDVTEIIKNQKVSGMSVSVMFEFDR